VSLATTAERMADSLVVEARRLFAMTRSQRRLTPGPGPPDCKDHELRTGICLLKQHLFALEALHTGGQWRFE